MKTKNKSVKRKILFDDSNEHRPLGVSKKQNVGHPTAFGFAANLSYEEGSSSNVNESVPQALETDKDKIQTNDVPQRSLLANTNCVSFPGNFPQEVADGAVPITQQFTSPAVTTTPPHIEEGAFHMPDVWPHQYRPMFATNPSTMSNGFNRVPTRVTQHCISTRRYRHSRTECNQQRNSDRRESRLANSIPLEYTHMGRCSA